MIPTQMAPMIYGHLRGKQVTFVKSADYLLKVLTICLKVLEIYMFSNGKLRFSQGENSIFSKGNQNVRKPQISWKKLRLS